MQAAAGRHLLGGGPQHQVIGVAEENLRAHRFEVVGGQGFHRSGGAHGHEDRRLNDAVGRSQAAAASAAYGGWFFALQGK